MRELKELISYFLGHAPHKLNKTEIVKMVYLFEYFHVQTYEKQYSNVTFIRYNYGPYTREIEDVLNEMIYSEELIQREHYVYSNNHHSYLHSPMHSNIEDIYTLDHNVAYIANTVIEKLSNKNYKEMLNSVYSTPPMVKILEYEDEVGSKQYGRELEMNECRKVRKFSRERIEKARQRLDRSSRGTDKEYYSTIMKENKELEHLKRRANYCLLK